nr:inositol 1,4,5-triphosphate receptor associated 1-like isoform X2 [Lepeophtheirus salmonis]
MYDINQIKNDSQENLVCVLFSEEDSENKADYGPLPSIESIRLNVSPWTRLHHYVRCRPSKELMKKYMITENLSDQDIESKFTSLSLAFKTDKLTLSNRLELQQRHRDTAERNIEEEIKDLKNAIGGLNRLCNDTETRDVLQRLTQQVDVLRQSSSRVSSAAEVYGAVQQEARIARAIEVMLLHVDNLKRLYEKEHSELEETRRILADHNLSHHEKGRTPSGLPSPDTLLDSSKFVVLPANDISSKSGRMRSVSVINNHSTESNESTSKLRRASYTAVSSTQKSPETLSASPPDNSRPRSPTTSIMLHKGQASRKIGVISGGFRKTSHSRTLKSENSIFSPIAEEGKEYELNGSKISTDAENDIINNNTAVKIKKKVSLVEDPSHRARTRLYWRSKSTIETSLSSSMTYSSSSNDEDAALLEEIDQLAIKRDSSPTRSNFRLKHHLSNIRKKSIIQNVMDWYRDFSWPWDWEETVLGFRYCLTGILLFAAFVSLVMTFFGASGASGGGSTSIVNEGESHHKDL